MKWTSDTVYPDSRDTALLSDPRAAINNYFPDLFSPDSRLPNVSHEIWENHVYGICSAICEVCSLAAPPSQASEVSFLRIMTDVMGWDIKSLGKQKDAKKCIQCGCTLFLASSAEKFYLDNGLQV